MLPRPKPTDPVRLGWLDPDDLCRSEKHAERGLSKPWAWASDKLSQPSSASLRDSPIYGARLTRLAFLTYGRNAWHSTWITRYTDWSIALTVGTLQSRAERLRTSGSVFKIDEIPALALQTEASTIFIVEVNRGRQLETLEDQLLGPIFSGRMIQEVAGLSKNSLVCLQAPERIIPPPVQDARPFHQFRSSSQGAHRSLAWSKTGLDLTADIARFEKLRSHFVAAEPLTQQVWHEAQKLPPEALLYPSKIEIIRDAQTRILRWGDACHTFAA